MPVSRTFNNRKKRFSFLEGGGGGGGMTDLNQFSDHCKIVRFTFPYQLMHSSAFYFHRMLPFFGRMDLLEIIRMKSKIGWQRLVRQRHLFSLLLSQL